MLKWRTPLTIVRFYFTIDINKGWSLLSQCHSQGLLTSTTMSPRGSQTALVQIVMFACKDLDTFSKWTNFSSEHNCKLQSVSKQAGKDSFQPTGWENENAWTLLCPNSRAHTHLKMQWEIQIKNNFLKECRNNGMQK